MQIDIEGKINQEDISPWVEITMTEDGKKTTIGLPAKEAYKIGNFICYHALCSRIDSDLYKFLLQDMNWNIERVKSFVEKFKLFRIKSEQDDG